MYKSLNPKPKSDCKNCLALSDELKILKETNKKMRQEKNKSEPKMVKEYFTSQLIGGKYYERKVKRLIYPPSFREKKNLRKLVCNLVSEENNIELLEVIRDCLMRVELPSDFEEYDVGEIEGGEDQ